MAVKLINRAALAKAENIAIGIPEEQGKWNLTPALLAELKKVRQWGDLPEKAGKMLVYYPPGKTPRRLLIYQLGKTKDLSLEKIRRAVGTIMKKAMELKLREVVFDVDSFCWHRTQPSEVAQAMSLAAPLSTYRFREFKARTKTAKPVRAPGLVLATKSPSTCTRSVRIGEVIAEAVNYARTLANRPGNALFPQALAQEARQLARKNQKLFLRVMQKQELHSQGFGALLAVGAGSVRPPVLIEMIYRGGQAGQRPVVLVGKGITFDSGGISLKPSSKMEEMRFDMSGAATVLGILQAVAQLKLPINLVGIIPAAENMPSGSATRPGDIVRSLSGTTIEILNTDAEGRLVLADGITYALRHKPASLIDFATLTGAVISALGYQATGLITNQEKLGNEILAAGQASGERAWQLPLWEEYKELMKSDVADIANIANKSGAGTITGAVFLERFVKDTPWVHLDIAGTAWGETGPIFEKGATGVGVRMIMEWLLHGPARG